MTPCAYQLMQMESLTADMEDMILFEVQKNDNALARIRQMRVALDEQQDYINILETTALNAGNHAQELLVENVALKVQLQQFLQTAPSSPATPPTAPVMEPQQEESEEESEEEPEEEPEEATTIVTDDPEPEIVIQGEGEPASNTRSKKRKTTSAGDYAGRSE